MFSEKPIDKALKKDYNERGILWQSENAFDEDALANSALDYLYADANKSKTLDFLKNNGFPSAQDRRLNREIYGEQEERSHMLGMLKDKTNSILNPKLPNETDRAFLRGLMGEKEGEQDYQKQISDANRALQDLQDAFRGTDFERGLKPAVPVRNDSPGIKYVTGDNQNATDKIERVAVLSSTQKPNLAQHSDKPMPPSGLQNRDYGDKGFWYIPGTDNSNPPSNPTIPSKPTLPSNPSPPSNPTPPNNPSSTNNSEVTNNAESTAAANSSEKVLLRYAVEQAGGTVTWDEKTGTAIATIDGDSRAYKCDIINGRMVIDVDTLANDFGKDTIEFQTNTDTTFNSEHDAALAFGLRYRKYSDENKLEYGAIIVSKEENGKKVYSYKNIVKSKPLLSKEDLTGASEEEITDAEDDFTRRGVDYDWHVEPEEQIEATIHTHWHPKGELDFSDDDYENQLSEVKSMYVVLRTSDFLYSERTPDGFTEKVNIF